MDTGLFVIDHFDGKTWGWALAKIADPSSSSSFRYGFKTREAAYRFAAGWIKRNRPDLIRAAHAEEREGAKWRKQQRASAA